MLLVFSRFPATFLTMADSPQNMQEAKDALDKAKAASDQKAQVTAMIQVAKFALGAADLKTAQSTANEARLLARKIGEAMLEVEAVSANVSVLLAVGEYEEATREAYDGLSICRRKGDNAAEGDALLVVVNAHHLSLCKENAKATKTQIEEDAFKEGVKELTQTALDTVKIFEKLDEKAKLGQANIKLAGVYMLAGEPDLAKNEAKKAYQIFYDLKDGNGYYDACMNLANAHTQRGDFNSAIRYANEAKQLCIEFQDAWGVSRVQEFVDTIKECIMSKGVDLMEPAGMEFMRVQVV